MTTFTNILPDNYDTSHDWYFVWHTPDPDATTSGTAWDANGKLYIKIIPDPARQRGTGNPVMAYMLGMYHRFNTEGQKWRWMPMPDFAAWMEGQPAQGAGEDGKVEALRARCRTALNRVDAARGMLYQAMDELESGVLG